MVYDFFYSRRVTQKTYMLYSILYRKYPLYSDSLSSFVVSNFLSPFLMLDRERLLLVLASEDLSALDTAVATVDIFLKLSTRCRSGSSLTRSCKIKPLHNHVFNNWYLLYTFKLQIQTKIQKNEEINFSHIIFPPWLLGEWKDTRRGEEWEWEWQISSNSTASIIIIFVW